MNLVIDNEFRNLIPRPAAGELELLESQLVSDGCRDSLVVWKQGRQSFLIDGHNRYEICTRLKIPFEITELAFNDRTEAILWIIDNQMGRRNIATIDRIALAIVKEALLRPLAKENQKRKPKSVLPILAKQTPADTRKECAKIASVGHGTYDAGKLILDAYELGEITEDVVEAIRGKEKSIHGVANEIKDKRQKTKRQAERKQAAAKSEPQFFDNVHIGDFREHADKVADGSLSLIFTDPPYDRKSLELFDGLADFADAKLCDGGSLICYVGHVQLLAAITCLSSRLRYWWIVACLHSGGNRLLTELGIRAGWKPVLWFVKNTRDNKEDIVFDVMSGGREKDHHDWQQAQSEAEYWIEHLCPKDGIVCDPFLGGGTTAAAAQKLKRKWVGFEKDHDQAVIAMQRCVS